MITNIETTMNHSSSNSSEAIEELIRIVSTLRDPIKGCPWDQVQTHKSLIPFVIEEAYEVADAIRHGDEQCLMEELGDLLLQVVLHAQIAKENNNFSLTEIVQGIQRKLVNRHPHVFGDSAARDIEEVNLRWDKIKDAEKPLKATNSPISDRLTKKIRGQSALAGAMNISKKAAKAGFEWKNIEGVWAKVHEELDELKEAIQQKDKKHAEEELGDVLFALINIGRWLDINPEEGLFSTNWRFLQRFSYIEKALKGNLSMESPQSLELLWKEAKAKVDI